MRRLLISAAVLALLAACGTRGALTLPPVDNSSKLAPGARS
ncbi:hypothetical protein RHDC4_00304 [Rhodocyclaceae bacterium]|nr:hypothetical protein RHDC4_00304 [Rhodocyclaceae bacterium]